MKTGAPVFSTWIQKLAPAAAVLTLVASAWGQQPKQPAARPSPSAPVPAARTAKPAEAGDEGEPVGKFDYRPTNPSEPIAVVNGEPITRANLADETVVRHGKEVLDNLINRKIVEQAIRLKKIQITQAEIDAEIDREAATIGKTDRKTWLLALSKNKGISPSQYAHDVIYPILAMRKLAAPRVQVSDQDMKDAYEAYFGERLRARIIMVGQQRHAVDIWEELKKNPGGFAKIASDDPRSIDQGSRSAGGLLPEPMTRHAHPRVVSDSVFRQLVDGDPQDKDLNHKPKDGDISGPIQVTESTWVLVKRESLSPAQPYDPNNADLRDQIRNMIFEAKIQQEMSTLMDELYAAASIDNRLVGRTKQANEQVELTSHMEGEVKPLSGQAPSPRTSPGAPLPGAASTVPNTRSAPAGITPDQIPPAVEVPKAAGAPAKTETK